MVKPLIQRVVLLTIALCACAAAHAEQYLSQDEALALAFEKPKNVRCLELPNREPMAEEKLKVFVGELKGGKGRGVAMIDAVIGKHQPITYMVVINVVGEIQRVEILEYRETYGGQVRKEPWRRQFTGKKPDDPPRYGEDIQNIAGATLSCRHVTEGVAKILKMFEERKSELLQ